jgi:hypothetical protein
VGRELQGGEVAGEELVVGGGQQARDWGGCVGLLLWCDEDALLVSLMVSRRG